MSKGMEKESTIMFTDMVGYSRLVNIDESKALSLLEEFNTINFSKIDKYKGKVIKLIGDSVFAEFDSAYHAIHASIEMQKEIRKRNKLSKKTDHFNMRIGLHKGKVIVKDNDLFGHTVNLGSRIEGIAPIGGIAISEYTFNDIKDQDDILSRKIGAIKLKNIKYPQTIYKIYLDLKDFNSETDNELIGHLRERDIVLVDDKNYKEKTTHPIALLYLDNLGEKEDEFFTYSIAESLISDLKKINSIRIPSIANVQKFNNSDLPDSEIGRRLQVDRIIKGNIIRRSNICQVNLEMIDLIEGKSIWNHTWKGNSNYTNILNGEMISGILEALDIDIPDYINEYFTRSKTENTLAHDNYLKGKKIQDLSNKPDDFKKAEKFFKKAIEMDPKFVEAYVELGTTYQWEYRYEEAEDILTEAEKLAKETHNNPGLAEVYSHFGIMYQHWGKFEKSLIYLEKSLEIQSDLHDKFEEAKIYQNIGNFYSYNTPKQDMKKAKQYLDRSLDIYEELEEDHAIANACATFSVLYKNMREYSESIKHSIDALGKFRALSMRFYEYRIMCVLSDTYIKLGMYNMADKYVDDILSISEEFEDYLIMGRTLHISSQIHLSNNKSADAIENLEESIENYHLAEKNDHILAMLLELSRIYIEKNNMNKAKRYLKKASRLIRKQKNTIHYFEYKIIEELLQIKESNQNIKALDNLLQELNKNIDIKEGYADWWYIANCYKEVGKHDKAKDVAEQCITTVRELSKRISDPEHRKNFLESNLLNKEIMSY